MRGELRAPEGQALPDGLVEHVGEQQGDERLGVTHGREPIDVRGAQEQLFASGIPLFSKQKAL